MQYQHGAQVAVEATLVSPLKRDGTARARAHWQDGAALQDEKKRKETRYPEFRTSQRCHLVVAGQEVGGRWSEEAYEFLLALALNKAETAPATLKGSAVHSYLRRWTSLLSIAAMDSLAHTLVH